MLQLKAATKQMFIDAGLEGFTIGRNALNNLAIVGPCGKAIVEVTNFAVGTKLTKAERDIAIADYLEPTLTKHSAVILDMIKFKEIEVTTKEAVEMAVSLESGKDKIKANMSQDGYGEFRRFSGDISFDNSEDGTTDRVSVKVNSDNEFVTTMNSSNATIAKGNLGLAIDLSKRLKVLHDLYNEYVDARVDFERAEKSMIEECAL